MNEKRILQQMAGLRDGPADKFKQRRERRERKMLRSSEARIKLIEQIMQREQGTPGFRIMLFANMSNKPK